MHLLKRREINESSPFNTAQKDHSEEYPKADSRDENTICKSNPGESKRVFVTTSSAIRIHLTKKYRKHGALAHSLYIFLVEKAEKQRTNRIWATVSYCQRGTSLSERVVRRSLNILEEEGYIIRYQSNNGRFGKSYIEIKHLLKSETIIGYHAEKAPPRQSAGPHFDDNAESQGKCFNKEINCLDKEKKGLSNSFPSGRENKYFDSKLKEIIDNHNNTFHVTLPYNDHETNRVILHWLNEGYSVDDFRAVQEDKKKSWYGSEKMRSNLIPPILYGDKFVSYLNCPTIKQYNKIYNNDRSNQFIINEVERQIIKLQTIINKDISKIIDYTDTSLKERAFNSLPQNILDKVSTGCTNKHIDSAIKHQMEIILLEDLEQIAQSKLSKMDKNEIEKIEKKALSCLETNISDYLHDPAVKSAFSRLVLLILLRENLNTFKYQDKE